MSWKVINLTLNGSAQQISSTRIPVQQVKIYNPAGNSDVYIGDASVSATDYAGLLDADDPPYDIGPFTAQGPVSLSEIYVLGTNNDVLHIGYVGH